MGKRKIEIKEIEEKNKMQVCFSKRRKGLFGKASELCTLCDAQIAIITFSRGGKAFTFGHPSPDAVINRYMGIPGASSSHALHSSWSQRCSRIPELERQLNMTGGKKTTQLAGKELDIGEWVDRVLNAESGAGSVEELKQLKHGLERLREKVLERLNHISAVSGPGAYEENVSPLQIMGPDSQPWNPISDDDELFYKKLFLLGVAYYLL